MRKLLAFVFVAALGLSLPASAAQIVALDLAPKGNTPARVAEALSPVLVAELSRREGMSVISQADVRALLELESNKALAGCSETSCMTDIAGSLGAELLCSSTLGRVGNQWVVSLTLIQVDGAKVVRRATGRAKGGDEEASTAVTKAVHELFRGEMPTELQGPASMTRRGFEAAMAGLRHAILDEKTDPKATRKRVVLDLVQTELDYDVKPKLDMLDLEIRRGRAEANRRALGAKNKRQLEHYLSAMDQYTVLWDDLGRVKEIRTRARERGLEPSARPLRFLTPDPMKRPDKAEVRRYLRRAKQARKIVGSALAAYTKGDEKTFVAMWKKDYAGNAKRELKSGANNDKRQSARWDLLPVHAHTPELLRRGISSMENENKVVVYRRRWRDGEVYDEDSVWLEKEDGRWRISSW